MNKRLYAKDKIVFAKAERMAVQFFACLDFGNSFLHIIIADVTKAD